MMRINGPILALLALPLGACAAAPAAARDAPFNRIAIIVDASGSYHERQAEAVEKAGELVRGVAERKSARWVTPDEILIISLDAAPEVIWRGTQRQLAATDHDEWIRLFGGRTDYAGCTDVARALNLAARELNAGPPAPTNRYLVAFSDLIDEPPTRGVSGCAPQRAVPDREIAWNGLQPLTSIAVFWMPPDQKMAWDAAMRDHGLNNYRLFSVSESGVNRIDPPDQAKHVPTAEERAMSQQTLLGWAKGALWALAALCLALALFALSFAFFRRRRRLRPGRPAPTPGARRGTAVSGPVAPLQLPPRR